MSTKLSDVKDKIFAKLKKSGWDIPLKDFIYSEDFNKIIEYLYKDSINGKKFTPQLKDIFKAFEECPYKDLKVVFLGQDPFPGKDIADGIAFSCSYTKEAQPTLQALLDEVNKTVNEGFNISTNPDLTRWANQGVLLINTALTTTTYKVGQHYIIWQPFMAYLFDVLTWYNPGTIYVYFGKKASEWKNAVNDNNYKFELMHPATSYYREEPWDCKDVFNKINKILLDNNNQQIEW
jgi:uracil-DNA glycosylase